MRPDHAAIWDRCSRDLKRSVRKVTELGEFGDGPHQNGYAVFVGPHDQFSHYVEPVTITKDDIDAAKESFKPAGIPTLPPLPSEKPYTSMLADYLKQHSGIAFQKVQPASPDQLPPTSDPAWQAWLKKLAEENAKKKRKGKK